MTAALWPLDVEPPDLCDHCAGDHDAGPHRDEFFWVHVDGVLAGPLCCGCVCDGVNLEVA